MAEARRRWTGTWRSTGSPARLRALRRFGLDLCLGRIVGVDDPEPVYIGRLGLTDSHGSAAADRLALTGRGAVLRRDARRPRWVWRAAAGTAGRAVGSATTGTRCSPRTVWTGSAAAGRPVGVHRQPRQQPVVPDARRAGHDPGRPGRRHPRRIPRRPRRRRRSRVRARPSSLCTAPPTSCTPIRAWVTGAGGVLVVGPHQPYLAYVADVLPSLGEEGVQTCTLRDLVAGGCRAPPSRPIRTWRASSRRRTWCGRSRRPSGSTRSRLPPG